MNNDTIQICKDWVIIEDYQYKILILASVLAENSLAYRGTLENMCEWLGISTATTNTKKIKEAIKELEKKQYIFYHKEGQIHHISITNKGLKDKRIVKVKKQWIETIKQYNTAKNSNINRSWVTMTKALTIILWEIQEQQKIANISDGIVITMRELGQEIHKCETSAGIIANKLTECNFDDGLKITKNTLYRQKIKKDGTKEPRAIGSEIRVFYDWQTEE